MSLYILEGGLSKAEGDSDKIYGLNPRVTTEKNLTQKSIIKKSLNKSKYNRNIHVMQKKNSCN